MFSGKQLKVLLEKVHYLIFWTMLFPTRPKIFLLSRKKLYFLLSIIIDRIWMRS